MRGCGWLAVFAAVFFVPLLSAHGGVGRDVSIAVESAGQVGQVNQADAIANFPLQVGGDFELIDHHGKWVTNDTYKGRYMLVFFGYVNCKNMCSISLARIGKALELLGEGVDKLTPLVITVDPERDTPAAMKVALPKFNPNFVGLTGTTEQLQVVYQNYKQQPNEVGKDANNESVISHSSYIYLMDKNGVFATLFPPALNPERMADIIRKHIYGAA